MIELVVYVEGETEQTFVSQQLAAHLGLFDIVAWPILPGRHRKRGGVKKWDVTRDDIIRTLKERRYCSTMIDYYAMPDDWPGRKKSRSMPWNERARYVEEEIAKAIVQQLGDSFDSKFFIPYVQLHEFEALAFADVNILSEILTPLSNESSEEILTSLTNILSTAGHPEAINDGYETCPSRRITAIVKSYKKRFIGPIITERIGLDVLRTKCNHFANWLERLENLKSLA